MASAAKIQDQIDACDREINRLGNTEHEIANAQKAKADYMRKLPVGYKKQKKEVTNPKHKRADAFVKRRDFSFCEHRSGGSGAIGPDDEDDPEAEMFGYPGP